ncbi:uncharacterized protein METZ01_LOCUS478359, partial [marine metagenome]
PRATIRTIDDLLSFIFFLLKSIDKAYNY